MTELAVGAVLALLLWRIGDQLQRQRRETAIQQLLAVFGPAAAAADRDPRQLLVWYPIARGGRALFPDAFKSLDAAAGGVFPFPKEQVKAAHARCSAEWLAWERAHDAEYAVKIAQVQEEIECVPGPPSTLLRTRLAAIEQQKLERYQQRYEEYVKMAKALAAIAE
jgi:hypothetical protein